MHFTSIHNDTKVSIYNFSYTFLAAPFSTGAGYYHIKGYITFRSTHITLLRSTEKKLPTLGSETKISGRYFMYLKMKISHSSTLTLAIA